MTAHRHAMELVAGKSPAAMSRALDALRAFDAGSPMATHRAARAAADALRDPAVEWTDDERVTLAGVAAGASSDPEIDAAARAHLSTLVAEWTAAGGSQAAFARDVLGRDADNLRDWLGGRALPGSLADWVSRIDSVARHDDRVVITVAPRQLERSGPKPRR